MSGEDDFLSSERQEVENTIGLIEGLVEKNILTSYEVIALGKLLQDVYMGIERILRFQLDKRGIKIEKSLSSMS